MLQPPAVLLRARTVFLDPSTMRSANAPVLVALLLRPEVGRTSDVSGCHPLLNFKSTRSLRTGAAGTADISLRGGEESG